MIGAKAISKRRTIEVRAKEKVILMTEKRTERHWRKEGTERVGEVG